jgi:phage terminase large subunit-like protein
MSSLSDAVTRLDEFGLFASELQIEDGSAFALQAYQRRDLVPYFDGCRELVILLPKKNGKSTLIAALALYHLLTVPNAECIIVAASREQADIVLRQARMFVRQSPSLSKELEIQQRTIRVRGEEGRIRILASDADTLDGALPTLAIVDELHRHKSADAYGVLRNGLGPRNGQIITISTAGSRSDSPLGQIRAQAHQLPTFARDGMRNTARSADGRFSFVEYGLGPDDDADDLETVKQANPAPWQSLEALAELKASTETRHVPWEWLRFFCGVWTEGEEPWIEPGVWDGLAQPFELEDKVFVGVDRGSRDEEPAIVLAAKRGDEIYVKATVFPDGTDFEDLEDAIRDLAPRIITASYDPNQFNAVAERLRKEGYQMREFPLTAERLSKASITLWDLIEKGRLHHDGDPALRSHVLGGIVKEDGRGWRIQRDPRSRQAVSGLMALLMACQQAAEAPSQDLMMSWG